MNATELRIGNWYLSVKFNIPVRCELTDLSQLCVILDGAYSDPPIDEMFAPIPLTDEWLLKFGFALHPWGWVLNNFLLRFEKPIDSKLFWVEIGNGLRVEVKYVHQLQNLFFSLCGEELN